VAADGERLDAGHGQGRSHGKSAPDLPFTENTGAASDGATLCLHLHLIGFARIEGLDAGKLRFETRFDTPQKVAAFLLLGLEESRPKDNYSEKDVFHAQEIGRTLKLASK